MTTVPHVGFVLEKALGHSTHADNLQHVISDDPRIRATWCPIPYDVDGFAARLPFYRSRWTLRAGLRARAAIRRAHHERPLDALFIHTQVAAILSTSWMKKVPTVVSIDATPEAVRRARRALCTPDRHRSPRGTQAPGQRPVPPSGR